MTTQFFNRLTNTVMKTTRYTKAQRIHDHFERMSKLGFSYGETVALRRIEMTLQRWGELECGTGRGHIERDEKTGIPRYHNDMHSFLDPHDPRAWSRIADREKGALKRLGKLMESHPELIAYHQGDPRGCALYILRKTDIREGEQIDSIYSRGVCANY